MTAKLRPVEVRANWLSPPAAPWVLAMERSVSVRSLATNRLPPVTRESWLVLVETAAPLAPMSPPAARVTAPPTIRPAVPAVRGPPRARTDTAPAVPALGVVSIRLASWTPPVADRRTEPPRVVSLPMLVRLLARPLASSTMSPPLVRIS